MSAVNAATQDAKNMKNGANPNADGNLGRPNDMAPTTSPGASAACPRRTPIDVALCEPALPSYQPQSAEQQLLDTHRFNLNDGYMTPNVQSSAPPTKEGIVPPLGDAADQN